MDGHSVPIWVQFAKTFNFMNQIPLLVHTFSYFVTLNLYAHQGIDLRSTAGRHLQRLNAVLLYSNRRCRVFIGAHVALVPCVFNLAICVVRLEFTQPPILTAMASVCQTRQGTRVNRYLVNSTLNVPAVRTALCTVVAVLWRRQPVWKVAPLTALSLLSDANCL